MIRRRGELAGSLLVVVLALTGCSSGTSSAGPADATGSAATSAGPTPTTTPTTPPVPESPAATTFRRLQASLKLKGGIEVRNGARGGRGSTTSAISADLRSGAFRAVLDLGPGRGRLVMLRIADTTWTQAPVPVWVGLGYTRASARRAQGKWVVATTDSVKALVGALDPTLLVSGIEQLAPSAAVSQRAVTRGPSRGTVELRVRSGGGIRSLFVTTGPHPLLTRVTSGTGAQSLDLRVVGYPATVDVSVPNASDVLQQP